jgi:hypothetical protein
MTKTCAEPPGRPRLPRRAAGLAVGAAWMLAKLRPVPEVTGTGQNDISYQGRLISLIASVRPRSSEDRREGRHRRRRHEGLHRRRDIQAGHVHCRLHGQRCLRGPARPGPHFPGSG